MNEEIKKKMQADIVKSKSGWGWVKGIIIGLLIGGAVSKIPGLDVLMETHEWPKFVLIIFLLGMGYFFELIDKDGIKTDVEKYDDDTLRYNHSKISKFTLYGIFNILINLLFIAFIIAVIVKVLKDH